MNIINLTPHDINILDDNDDIIRTYGPSGTVARVATFADVFDDIDGVAVATTTYGPVTGVPDPVDGNIFVVSSLVAQRLANVRTDVVSPDTSPQSVVRNDAGHVVGVKRFQRFGA